jgi:precorrin-3B methylase
MNFCMCGSQAGYPHEHDCPYPLYNCRSEEREREWLKARERLLANRAEQERLELASH